MAGAVDGGQWTVTVEHSGEQDVASGDGAGPTDEMAVGGGGCVSLPGLRAGGLDVVVRVGREYFVAYLLVLLGFEHGLPLLEGEQPVRVETFASGAAFLLRVGIVPVGCAGGENLG